MQNKFKVPLATLSLSLAMVIFYFLLSGGRTYITPLSAMYPLGVSSGNMIGALTYTLTHIGLKHLIGNLAAFIVLGTILEQRIDKWHASGIFLVSGVFGGAVYALIHPDVWVVGASTAIAGTLAAGLVAEPKKTLLAFVIVMFLVPSVVLPATDYALDKLDEWKEQQALAAKERAAALALQIKTGNYTNKTVAEKQSAEEMYGQTVQSQQSLQQGRSTEAATPASMEIHVLGALFALGFLWLFDRGLVREQWRRLVATLES